MAVVHISYPYVPTQVLYRDGADVVKWGRVPDKARTVVCTGYTNQDAPYLLTLEPPTVLPHIWTLRERRRYQRVFTHAPMEPEEIRIRYPWPIGWPMLPKTPRRVPWSSRIDGWVVVAGNKCSDATGQLYKYRHELIEACRGQRIDIYGAPAWDCDGYQGQIPLGQKIDVMSRYRYAMALENTEQSGYFTEKLPDVLAAGCLPLYVGHRATALDVCGEWLEPYLLSNPNDRPQMTDAEHQRYLDQIDLPRIAAHMAIEDTCKTILSCL